MRRRMLTLSTWWPLYLYIPCISANPNLSHWHSSHLRELNKVRGWCRSTLQLVHAAAAAAAADDDDERSAESLSSC